MARIGKARTEIIRVDPKFKKFVEECSRLKSYQENDKITPARITQAMYNQWQKYPELTNELKRTKLGRWNSK